MTDFQGRIVLQDELYDVTCTCRPANPPNVLESCNPTIIKIEFLGQFEGEDVDGNKPLLDAVNLRKLVGAPEDLRVVDLLSHGFSSVDGRSSDEVLGTWGGDAGELLLASAVWEEEKQYDLSVNDVKGLLVRYLTFMKQTWFYVHTDTKALAWVEREIGFDRERYDVNWLDITRPPREFQDALLDALTQVEGTGSLMFKHMLELPERYKIRKGLIETFIRALYLVLWDPEQPLNSRIKYYVLHAPGPRHESAWIEFAMGNRCFKENRVVMFPPFSDGISVFVHHAQALEIRRNQTATYVQSMMGGTGDLKEISEKIQSKGKDWDEVSKVASSDVLKGLPRYRVVVMNAE